MPCKFTATRPNQLWVTDITFVATWRLYPVVQALMTMRGVRMIVAVTVIAELQRRGAITKTGNHHVRRILIEAAWSYRFFPR